MPEHQQSDPTDTTRDFRQQADQADQNIVAELIDFMKHNKKWWLTPIIVILLLVGLLIIFSSSAAAPFIYALF